MTRDRSNGEQEVIQTTFKFNKQTLEIIDQHKKDFGATTKAEVIRKALALLEVARQARQSGSAMAVVDSDGTQHKILGI